MKCIREICGPVITKIPGRLFLFAEDCKTRTGPTLDVVNQNTYPIFRLEEATAVVTVAANAG